MKSCGAASGWEIGTPQIPVGASAFGLSIKSTACESGDQNGWVQHSPDVKRVSTGAGVGDGEGVGEGKGDGVTVGLGDGGTVGDGTRLAVAVTGVGTGVDVDGKGRGVEDTPGVSIKVEVARNASASG